jgi:hypothetical protein
MLACVVYIWAKWLTFFQLFWYLSFSHPWSSVIHCFYCKVVAVCGSQGHTDCDWHSRPLFCHLKYSTNKSLRECENIHPYTSYLCQRMWILILKFKGVDLHNRIWKCWLRSSNPGTHEVEMTTIFLFISSGLSILNSCVFVFDIHVLKHLNCHSKVKFVTYICIFQVTFHTTQNQNNAKCFTRFQVPFFT